MNISFALIVLLIGIVLLVVNFKIDAIKCIDTSVHSANKSLLIIAVIAIMSALSYFTCASKCGCLGNKIGGDSFALEVYIVFMFIVGVVLTSVGVNLSKKATKTTECLEAASYANTVVILGSVLLGLTSSYFLYYMYEKYKGKSVVKSTQKGTEMMFKSKSHM